ncbi:efflux RND transporter periplasmic adaptor subunit [Flavivirga abyssicola]|uniref:efflux RND transporter periplasmic adaptor subunit n=1 Tax=Flavivirga abyssicola TaxID=3063533 RepID=UPI0026DFCC93|nr:efflux RND transporter periplasmic adaptor subunit [Flavivirga sp. MEBiC07777]WVK14187.1 efflux RND transporter periplasmic adaptor subunit [Flavivirga sp. MEBiC07777]
MIFFKFLFVLCILFSCKEEKKKTNIKENSALVVNNIPKKVKYNSINFGNFELELKTTGRVYAKKKVDVKFVLNEKIASINVINGQNIKRGQILASQNNTVYRNKVIKAKEQLERAKIDVEDILIGFNLSLKDSLKIPKTTLDMAKNRGNYNTSISNLRDANIELASTTLRAPINGVIANLEAEKYSYPDLTKPFCTIIDDSVFDVEFNVLEENFMFLKKGQALEINNTFSEIKFNGEIIEINPIVDENGLIKVKGAFKNIGKRILDGMNVNITIKKIIPNKLFVIKKSIVLRDNKKVVFTVKDGKAIWNYVETSLENSDYIVIERGLKKNDKIIYSGNINLAHNSSIIEE